MKGLAKRALRTVLPRAVAPRRILAGPLRGRRIVTSWHDYPAAIMGRTELSLLRWFREHVGSSQTWLDVGGHYGYTAIALAECVGVSGRVFTFEPVVASAGCIAQARAINGFPQLIVVPFGLGSPDTIETRRLQITRGMADLTLGEGPSLSSERICVARFDWLWPHLNEGLAVVHGIKIDVQGMELEVLAGMESMLREQRPALLVELHHGVDRSRLLSILEAAGYSTSATRIDGGTHLPAFADDCSYAFVPAANR